MGRDGISRTKEEDKGGTATARQNEDVENEKVPCKTKGRVAKRKVLLGGENTMEYVKRHLEGKLREAFGWVGEGDFAGRGAAGGEDDAVAARVSRVADGDVRPRAARACPARRRREKSGKLMATKVKKTISLPNRKSEKCCQKNEKSCQKLGKLPNLADSC